jgi:hypothetical protein
MRAGILAMTLALVIIPGALAQTMVGPAVGGEGGSTQLSSSTPTIQGATPEQEALLREELRIVEPPVVPLRIIFVPHWKYIYTAKEFQLHVPTGMSSVMFTHLASRSVFIDESRILSDDRVTYWMAHELGHLATNSTKESDAERAAKPYRARLTEATKQAKL